MISKDYLLLSGAKSQGMKQLMSGLGLILLAIVLVPVLETMMTGAV
jgi:tetrahydromethanopterin S-methyltransferase subunit F